MTNDDTTRAAACAMLKAGEATLAEAAELAGTSRQLVRYWAQQAGIDVATTRAAWLAKRWAKHNLT